MSALKEEQGVIVRLQREDRLQFPHLPSAALFDCQAIQLFKNCDLLKSQGVF